ISGPTVTSPILGLGVTASNVYATSGGALQILSPSLGLVSTIVGGEPRSVAANGYDVYWSDRTGGGGFYRSKGGTICAVADPQEFPTEVALSATHAYWTTADGIARAPLATCYGSAEAIVSGLSDARTPTALTVDATETFVYWTDTSRVYRAPIAGGTP